MTKSSLNPQYLPGITSHTPAAVSSLTPVPAALTPLIIPQQYLRSIMDDQQGGDKCGVSVTTDTSSDTLNNQLAL